MSASPTSAASNPVARQRAIVDASRTPDSATARRSPGTSVAQPDRPLRVHVERPQVAVVDPDDAGVGREGRVELARVVRLDERLEAEVAGLAHEARETGRRVEDGEQEHEVGPGSPEEVELPGIDDELLREDRDGDGGADGPEVVHGAPEPVRLAEDGDGRRAARGVGAGARDGVVRGGDRARPTASGA